VGAGDEDDSDPVSSGWSSCPHRCDMAVVDGSRKNPEESYLSRNCKQEGMVLRIKHLSAMVVAVCTEPARNH
jgi:hypothetical protein